MLTFRTIDLERDWALILCNRRDSFIVSFGPEADLTPDDVARYRHLMAERVVRWPTGTVLAFEGADPVGQLELRIRDEDGVGYVNLFYLNEPYRGTGHAQALHDYVDDYFRDHGVTQLELRVSPTNRRARRFYEKRGWVPLFEEQNEGRAAIRMGRTLPPADK